MGCCQSSRPAVPKSLKPTDVVERLWLLEFNARCLFWAKDCVVLHVRKHICYTRRILFLLLLLSLYITNQFFRQRHKYWGCYADSVAWDKTDLGTCDDPQAPIHKSPLYVPNSVYTVSTAQWVTIAIAGVLAVVFFGLHIYDSVHFKREVRVLALDHEEELFQEARDHLGDTAASTEVVQFLQVALQHGKHHELEAVRSMPACVILHRVAKLFGSDPISAVLGLNQYILHDHKRFIAQWINNLLGLINNLCYVYLIYPDWAATCCLPPGVHHSWRYGACDDSGSPISNEPTKVGCDLYTFPIGMWCWLIGVVLHAVISLVLSHHAVVAFIPYLEHAMLVYMEGLAALVESNPTLRTNINQGALDYHDKKSTRATQYVFDTFMSHDLVAV